MDSSVPEAITFGKKILWIPSLKEVGIPVSYVVPSTLSAKLKDYSMHWIERGDPIIEYEISYFNKDKKEPDKWYKFRKPDTRSSIRFEIKSPISGLMVDKREEESIGSSGSDLKLPVLLVPNDEPLPDDYNFYIYNHICKTLAHVYWRIAVIEYAYLGSTYAVRLREWSNDFRIINFYQKSIKTLQQRRDSDFEKYAIREISKEDKAIISNIQDLRTRYTDLRQKLVHISREFGESI